MNILVISGHPRAQSLCNSILDRYVAGALEWWHQLRSVKLSSYPDLNYNLIEWEEDGDPIWQQWREDLLWSQHLVFIFPTRRYSVPGCLKGRFDKIFVPKFSHQYTGYMKWKKMLWGRTGSVISTCGGPWFTYIATLWHPGIKRIRWTMRFVGIKPKRKKLISKLVPWLRSEAEITSILQKIHHMWMRWR